LKLGIVSLDFGNLGEETLFALLHEPYEPLPLLFQSHGRGISRTDEPVDIQSL
jgi:hypothetical protein